MSSRPSGAAGRLATALFVASGLGCGDDEPAAVEPRSWQALAEGLPAALMSVTGTAEDDVWMVGAAAGEGPLVLHHDGASWAALDTGARADLWWAHALRGGSVFMGGSNGTLLVYRDGAFQRLATPGLAKHTVFGVWAAAEDDVYAVGSIAGFNGFIWHYDGVSVSALRIGAELPADSNQNGAGLFKVWGASAEDVWVVGDRGTMLRGNARDGFRYFTEPLGPAYGRTDERLFTVHGGAGRVVAVGGSGSGVALEVLSVEAFNGPWTYTSAISPPGASLLQGVHVADSGAIWAVGLGGNIYTSEPKGGEWQETLTETPVQSLHSVWVDPKGTVWTVGGNVLVDALDGGVALRGTAGSPVARLELPPPEPPSMLCPAEEMDPAPNASVARRWNEQLIGAIRRDVPRPMVQARNLFHASVAMWDAWAAYDGVADGYVTTDRASAADAEAARREAISYAAYRVLQRRFASAAGSAISLDCFAVLMRALGYDPLDESVEGGSPRALGNRIGRAVLDAFAADGANEAGDYEDPTYDLVYNTPLLVDVPGTLARDPLHWQPIELRDAQTLNGIALGTGRQENVGSHWGDVTPFALTRPAPGEPYLDIGEPPTPLATGAEPEPNVVVPLALRRAAVELIVQSGQLGIEDGVRLDVSPGARGNNSLGENDGVGRARNPITGLPYEPRSALRGDFARALVAYWENGPRSETPPGHWNALASGVSSDARFERRLFGAAGALDALAWDVHLYFALNGALHDAAIAAWELKQRYASARPITLLRYLAQTALPQRADEAGYADLFGLLPIVEGSIDSIDAENALPGGPYEALGPNGLRTLFRVWPGEPGDPRTETASVRWIRGYEWVPFQPRSFVSPPYPAYVAENSVFARAAAEVLTRLTGSEYFPGGLGGARIDPGAFRIEAGPSEPVELEWATYADAADQSGQSSTWAGINLSVDDRDGRRVGARAGAGAVELARSYFDGSARP